MASSTSPVKARSHKDRGDRELSPTELRDAIKTIDYPHRTTCMVRRVTDTHIEAQFRYEAENEWVLLPLSEVVYSKIVDRVSKVTSGEYAVVELGLNDHHPVTEIEALRAQVRAMRELPSRRCSCGERSGGASDSDSSAPFIQPREVCHQHCDYSSGCGHWHCWWHCVRHESS